MAVQRPAAAAVPARQRISVVRDNFVAGGILPEGDYEITMSHYIIFAYTTKDGKPTGVNTCALQLKLQPLNAKGEAEGTEQEQIYSVGDVAKYAPSEDGNFIEAVGTTTTLSNQSNFNIIHESLLNAGMPEKLFDDEGAGILVGVKCHIAHIPAPDRSSLQAARGVTGAQASGAPTRDLPKTIPVVKVIISAPWDRKGKAVAKPTATTKKAAAAPEPPAESNGAGDNDRLLGYVTDVLGENKNKLAKAQLRLKVHQRYNKDGVEATERDAELAIFNDMEALTNLLASVDTMVNDDGTVERVQ